MNYKKICLIYLFIAFFSIFIISLAFYSYDPLSFFGKNKLTKDKYHLNDKHSPDGAFGLKSIVDENIASFNSVILGSSMLRNLDGKWLDSEELSFANLSANGFSVKNRYYLLSYILKKKALKEVYYSLDMSSLIKEDNDLKYAPLFSPNIIERFYESLSFYLSRGEYIDCLLSLSEAKECVGEGGLNLSLPKFLHNTLALGIYLNFLLKDTYLYSLKDDIMLKTNLSETLLKARIKYFQKYLFALIAKYPNTSFKIIIPPYSRLYFRIDNFFYDRLILLKNIIKEGEKYPNLTFYFFQNEEFTKDWRNFTYDLRHYRKEIYEYIAKRAKNNKNIINTSNLRKSFELFVKNIRAYDLKADEAFLKKGSPIK